MKTLTAAAAMLLLACAAPARADPAELINDVETATVSRTGPDTVTVCARGTVTTGGWTRPALVPVRVSHKGVYDLDFVAVKPEGMATQMISPITARFVWTGAPADLTGVRVRGERSAALANLGQGGGC